jgi:protocatechuate 3,4-dioxygenase alpha subunit
VQDNGITPSQTVGPFFKYGLTPTGEYAWNDAFTNSTLTPDVTGNRVRIEGRVFDGDGVVVPDVMLEIWQADAQGRFADLQDKRALPNASFRGFARCGTDKDGNYSFETIKPGAVPDPDGTRIYFSDEAGNASDPVLAIVPADRRATLTAVREAGKPVYRLDLRLQGDNETVFFDV